MNRNNHDDAYTALALLIVLFYYLYGAITYSYSKDSGEPVKKTQEPKTASSSASSEYVKEESELEKSLVTSEVVKEAEVSNSSDEMVSYEEIDSAMYYSRYIGYVNSEKYGNKFYLFDYDSETSAFKEVNGLFAFNIYDASGKIVFTPAFSYLTEEENQILLGLKEGSIRKIESVVKDLNKEFVNKSNEEILNQLKRKADENATYEAFLIYLLIDNRNGENTLIPVLDIENDMYYEINGKFFCRREDARRDKIEFYNLGSYIYSNNDDGKYNSFDKSYLSVEEINTVTALINQEQKQELNGKSRSLTR